VDNNRVSDKLDKIAGDITSVKVDIAAMKPDIANHIKRCDLLEAQQAVLKSYIDRAIGGVLLFGLLGTILNIVIALKLY
jgi:hypothetical protein